MSSRINIKKGDQVQVIRGKGVGRRTTAPKGTVKPNPVGVRGRVKTVLRKEGRVVVERVHVTKKATRSDPRTGVRGGILDQENPLPISNVMLVCTACDAPRRVRFEKRDNKRVRLCRKCGGVV